MLNLLLIKYEKVHLPHDRRNCYRLYVAKLSSVSPKRCNIATY